MAAGIRGEYNIAKAKLWEELYYISLCVKNIILYNLNILINKLHQSFEDSTV